MADEEKQEGQMSGVTAQEHELGLLDRIILEGHMARDESQQ